MPSVMFVPRVCVPLIEGEFSLISIGDPAQLDSFIDTHPTRARLEFDDVEEFIDNSYVYFDLLMARNLLKWIKKQGDGNIVVHCEAGISRSAAVAKFMVEEMGYLLKADLRSMNDWSGYNKEVYRLLKLARVEDLMITPQKPA